MSINLSEAINVLGEFCGKRDISELTSQQLKKQEGIAQADVYVLFGGSILAGGDVLAEAITNKIAKTYIIVGGQGHTTEVLRKKMHAEYPGFDTKGLSEAQIFSGYLQKKFGLYVDYLECESTNCGNNIINLLALLHEKRISYKSIILSQDATMQARMSATLKKYTTEDKMILNYATYQAKVIIKDGKLCYEKEIFGMWDIERYITLLLGEIARLRDDTQGYGPNGEGFIAHVDIPTSVEEAFQIVRAKYAGSVRKADSKYASKNNI